MEKLPAEVHDHFRKANVLHGYVQKDLGEATKHALETGRELLAAKAAIPHGRWESECDRLFDGSLRTAQFYMQFAKNVSALPETQSVTLLMLEGTLVGAAKAAKQAAKPRTPKQVRPLTASSPDPFEAPESPQNAPEAGAAIADYGKCPNCAGTRWSEDEFGVACVKCHHPWGEPAGDVNEERIAMQRSKTVKTVEALVRAFDDLNLLCPKSDHGEAIHTCKQLLKMAREWK